MMLRANLYRWYFEHRGWLGYLSIFVIAFLLFAYFQYTPIFADPDSFYHAKIAVQLRDGEFIKTFTALPFTTLAQAYADQHFLYHLLLVPFVTAFDPLAGLKFATVILGATFALTFYWFLRRWNIPWAFVATLTLLLVNPFTFRMNLAKASSLSLTLLFLGMAAAFSYRPWLLAPLAFAYVWFYGGFALLVVVVLTFAVISYLHRRFIRHEDSNVLLHRIRALLGRAFRHGRRQRLNLQISIAVVVGTALGLVLNPFFPDNVRFYYDQLIRIGAFNYRNAIGVGGEWYSYGLVDLIANTVLVSIPLVIALVLFVINFRKQSSRSMTLFVLWLFFFLLTLKSRRYVEYYVPFAMLFAVVSLTDSLRGFPWRNVWRELWRTNLRSVWARVGVCVLALYVAFVIPMVVVRDFVTERRDLNNGFRLGLYQSESEWIMQHGQPGSIVFHSDWDEFPVLYYYNSSSRYIAGLDPTFLYLEDPVKHRRWADITLGKKTTDLYATVRGMFNADFVFITHDHGSMEQLFRNDSRFELGFSGPDANVYRVKL